MAGGMGAAVVRREQLDVLVKFAPIDLVLDAVVGEMDLLVEVRQIVFARPVTNLVLVAAGRPSLSERPRLCSCRNSWYSRFRSCSRMTRRISRPVVLVSEPRFLLAIRRVEIRVVVDLRARG